MKPTLLIILDGWGERAEAKDNSVKQAKLPHFDSFLKNYSHTLIDASGTAVGLPHGLMGNSEVGHLTMGAGRVVLLGLTRVYAAIEDGSFFENGVLKGAMEAAKKNHSALHVMGLLSDGAVHSHQDHLYALLKMAKGLGLPKVFIHAFTDGRDTPPKSAVGYVKALEEEIKKIGVGRIVTVTGRFYAMDRDKRWDRTALAYEAMVEARGRVAPSAQQAVEIAYGQGETDEFIRPTLVIGEGQEVEKIRDGDAVIFFNFRADRARQISRALTQADFNDFDRRVLPKLSYFACFSEYDSLLHLPVAFPKIDIHETFPEVISAKGLKQLRIAETEKYAHVTYFFSGGKEPVYPGEDRALIPSPKEVATYDLKPEMSAKGITEELLKRLKTHSYDFVICNFANPDMVGHTGNLPAAVKAVETVDACLGEIVDEALSQDGTVLITADHGNCEQMKDGEGSPHTAHTTNLVPFILIGKRFQGKKLRSGGKLIDLAPTLLDILGIPQPKAMTGKSLIVN
ncbi:MAG: 2,3-bisphosphoglycerate-independent phosphoglycerate mutase [bacterium]